MRMKAKKVLFFIMVLLVICLFSSCFDMVEGPMKFRIKEFEEYFEIVSEEEGEKYLHSQDMGFAMIEDVIVIPFIKEGGIGCVTLIEAYCEEEKSIYIDEVSLETADGELIYCIENYGYIDALSRLQSQMIRVNEFEKNSEWFFGGNVLKLTIKVSVKSNGGVVSEEFVYDVTLVGHYGPSWQV